MKDISSAQEAIWLTQNIYTGSSLYNVGGYALIAGSLNETALIGSIRDVLEGADTLTIGYYCFNDLSMERNSAFTKIDIGTVDFSCDEDPDRSCQNWMRMDIREQLDVRKSLLKVRVLKSNHNRYYWYTKVHHLVFDGYSMSLFFKNVAAFYSARLMDDAGQTDANTFLYSDFIQDDKSYRLSDEFKKDREFWLGRLKSIPDSRAFQSCMNSSHKKSLFSSRREIPVSRELYDHILLFCESHHCTSFHYFLTALLLLNNRYNNDVPVIGIPVFNRRSKKYKSTLGTFVNILPFSIQFEEEQLLTDLLHKVRDELKDCYKHQRFPLYDLLDELDREGNIYTISFSYQKNSYQTDFADLSTSIIYLHNGEQQEDLAFHLLEYTGDGDLTLSVDYNKELFNPYQIDGLLTHFHNILHSFLINPDLPVRQLEYLNGKEKHQLLAGFNDTLTAFSHNKTLVELFEEQVRSRPDHMAVWFAGANLSFRELNELSNQLGNYLRDVCHMQPNDLAGIRLQRSHWLVIAILGVLKSGAAYVPIDPEYPQDRIDYILSDSRCKRLIDEEELARFRKLQDRYDKDNLSPVAKPGDLAYVIYTSGSTGQPKGCMLEHRGVVNRLEWMWRQLGFDSADVILQKTSFTFDVSVWEFFLPLCFGAKMVMCTKEDAGSPQRILALIEQQQISCLHFVPGMLTAFIASLWEEELRQRLRSLRRVITSGEALLPETVKSWYARVDIPIHNLYGPTEASVDVSWYPTSAEDLIIPIGCPIDNTHIYITDRSLQLLPVGTTGEIGIAGICLARGYLNKPALTEEKFVPNPFREGERMYRTGDMGRWLPGGNIEYLGRRDNQVKIRGYRIELGEIENALLGHPDIDAAVVIARQPARGEKELVAYIVCSKPLADIDIRSYLGRLLPAYMLPGRYIPILSIPLTVSGKVDRKRLPAPEETGISGNVEYIAPRNRLEERLAVIWSEVLMREQIGIKDDFFALGGHSLKAIRLASRIHKEFDVEVELSQLFQTTILEDQAQLIAQTERKSFSAITATCQQPHYPLSPSQRRLWILNQFEESNIAYNMPGGYILEGNLDPGTLELSFGELISRHEILRTFFKEDERGEPRQFIYPVEQSTFRIDHVDLRRETQPERKLQTLVESSFIRPFDLAAAPLLRAELYQLRDNKWMMSFVMHHIISDGWSVDILIRELIQCYNTCVEGRTPPLIPPVIQYKDYTVWQQEQLTGGELADHRQYWMTQLEGELPVLEIMGDKLRPAIKTYHGGLVNKRINPALTAGIGNCGRQQGATLFMGLLAAVNVLLYRYTGQKDLIIGTPVAGRPHIDLEEQIGFYVNMLPLRNRFRSGDNFREWLEIVKESTLRAYRHQAYPFDTLIEDLNLRRDTSRSPLFDVLLVMQHAGGDPMKGLRPGELVVKRYTEANVKVSKFDLTFTFIETGEEMELTIEYNSDIFERSTVTRMADYFERLLTAITGNPETPVEHLEYLSAGEKQQLLETFNDTNLPYPEDQTVITLFEKRVATSPGNIAVCFENTSVTYRELNEWANQLGNYLRENFRIQPGDPVGIILERSEWMIVAILGVLKAGGAYVPIDPDYPPDRIDHMLKDSRCKALIDTAELGLFRKEKEKYEKLNLPPCNKADNPIYIIYTSGSTGRPKGAMVKHHSFVNLVLWYEKLLEIDEKDGVLLMAPISFDLAQKNIFTPLINGAKLCLPAKLYGDYTLLAETIYQMKVTVANAAPSAFYPLLDVAVNDAFKRLASLKKVVLGGEPIAAKEFMEWIGSGLYNAEVINSYGPTECTDVVSFYIINNAEWATLKKIPIGAPINNCHLYILDDSYGLLPVGVAGEIFIGGVCVGLGYFDQPGLTAEKFVPNPFRESERMYRTGDMGMWLPDGNIWYIGRKDSQVKVRGYRIELGEIERILQDYPGIESVAVVAKGGKELVAYLSAVNKIPVTSLRAYLSGVLPAYMIPDHFVQLQNLPLTPSGKLDRTRLPEPDYAGIRREGEYIAPRTPMEEVMIAIWCEVLGKEKIGIRDNFFQLGGHSLKAVQLISRINRDFLVRINIQSVFNEPTVENMCEQITFFTEQDKMKMNKDSLMPIEI